LLVMIFTAERSPFQRLVSLGVAARIRIGGGFDGDGCGRAALGPARPEGWAPTGGDVYRADRRLRGCLVEMNLPR
jgi:hypothetical protein